GPVADIDRCGVLARDDVERGEIAARIDRRTRDGEGENVGGGGRVRIPTRGGALGCIERGDLVARLPTNGGEEAADVNELTGNCECCYFAVGVRIPGCRRAVG